MKKLTCLAAALTIVFLAPVYPQERGKEGEERGGGQARTGGHNVGGGYIPPHGPAPTRATQQHAAPAAPTRAPQQVQQQRPAEQRGSAQREEPERSFRDEPSHPEAPHVHTNGQWVGHDTGANPDFSPRLAVQASCGKSRAFQIVFDRQAPHCRVERHTVRWNGPT